MGASVLALDEAWGADGVGRGLGCEWGSWSQLLYFGSAPLLACRALFASLNSRQVVTQVLTTQARRGHFVTECDIRWKFRPRPGGREGRGGVRPAGSVGAPRKFPGRAGWVRGSGEALPCSEQPELPAFEERTNPPARAAWALRAGPAGAADSRVPGQEGFDE